MGAKSWGRCDGCRQMRTIDEGHVLCRQCEGYPVSPCSTCGGSGKRYPRLTTFDDPCPDCREVS